MGDHEPTPPRPTFDPLADLARSVSGGPAVARHEDPLGQLNPIRPASGRRDVILLAEDCPEDRELIEWAFDECLEQVRLRRVCDGREALDYLLREGIYESPGESPRPSLVLLDLKLPRVDGFEVLRRMRETEELRRVPVIVFSGSDDEVDVKRAYDLGANSYLVKPQSMEGYRNVIRVLEAYWLRKAEIPPVE